jgi:hypothetical protein
MEIQHNIKGNHHDIDEVKHQNVGDPADYQFSGNAANIAEKYTKKKNNAFSLCSPRPD